MTVNQTLQALSLPALPVDAKLVCYDAAEPARWELQANHAQGGAPIQLSSGRIQTITLGAGMPCYVLAGRAESTYGGVFSIVCLLNPFDVVANAAVSSWLLTGLPGNHGAALNETLNVRATEVASYVSLAAPLRHVGSVALATVMHKFIKDGRLADVVAQKLGLEEAPVCAVVESHELVQALKGMQDGV